MKDKWVPPTAPACLLQPQQPHRPLEEAKKASLGHSRANSCSSAIFFHELLIKSVWGVHGCKTCCPDSWRLHTCRRGDLCSVLPTARCKSKGHRCPRCERSTPAAASRTTPRNTARVLQLSVLSRQAESTRCFCCTRVLGKDIPPAGLSVHHPRLISYLNILEATRRTKAFLRAVQYWGEKFIVDMKDPKKLLPTSLLFP